MDVVGPDATKGVIKVEPCVRRPRAEDRSRTSWHGGLGKGKGAGPENKVGTSYYNYRRHAGGADGRGRAPGVPEGAERADHRPLAERRACTAIKDFTADGMLPADRRSRRRITRAAAGRGSRAGTAPSFVPASDWFSANQDIVWEEIRKYSAEFKKCRANERRCSR